MARVFSRASAVMLSSVEPGQLLAIVCERIQRRLGLTPVRDVQVLCPTNRGGLSPRALNLALQQAL